MTLGAEAIAAALVKGVRTHGIGLIAWPEPAQRLRTRAAYAGIDAIGDAALIDRIEDWFPPLIAGKRGLDDIDPASLCQALAGLLDWDGRKALEDRAPAEFVSPADTRHAIDYAAHAGPTVTLRVQAMFGLDVHPVIGVARMPLILSLTSPAGRPIQTTRDLPGFWRSSWADVAKDMRGAYPKHNWPERPWEATASLKTKNALARG
jgi:ATP-dependent helicase HrpB